VYFAGPYFKRKAFEYFFAIYFGVKILDA